MGDLLAFDLSEDASVVYHIAGDSLRGTSKSSRRRYAVTLTRATLAEVMVVPASVPGVVTGTTVRIPITESGPGGKRVTLEATLYRPADNSPHPVLLFNHGSTGGGTVAAYGPCRDPEGRGRRFLGAVEPLVAVDRL